MPNSDDPVRDAYPLPHAAINDDGLSRRVVKADDCGLQRHSAETDDHELLRRAGEGDRDAFGVLVRRHQTRMLALAYRFLGRWDAAEDVCQEAFVRVFRAAKSYRPEARFGTWLYRIVANLCWDSRRSAARGPRMISTDDATAQWGDSALPDAREQSERDERRQAVLRAVGELPDRQRLVMILHRFEGLGHREITAVTGWSAGAVESCLVRGYARLRELLVKFQDG